MPHADVALDTYELLMGIVAKDPETIGESLFAMGAGNRDFIKAGGRLTEAVAEIIPDIVSDWSTEHVGMLDDDQKKLVVATLMGAGMAPETADNMFHWAKVVLPSSSQLQATAQSYKDSMSFLGSSALDPIAAVGITPDDLSDYVTKALEFVAISPEDPRYKPVGLPTASEMFREAEDFVPGYPYTRP